MTPPAFSKTSTRRSTERPMAFEAERNQSPRGQGHDILLNHQQNNNQTINETNENPTKPTNKTNKSKPNQTTTNHKSKNNQTNNPTKKGAISPQNQSPAGFSTSTRCISSEPGQDLWEWYIFCLPPKQEQPQIGLNVVYLSHGSSGLANELFHPYMSRICDTSRGNKLTN